MSTVPAPVFGPNREQAARRAFAELANAEAAYKERCTGWSDYDCPATRARYNAAKDNAAQYYEYSGVTA